MIKFSILTALVAVAAYYLLVIRNDSLLSSRDSFLPIEPGDAVIVTGSSTGIGKHAALSLAKEGYTVFACVRKPQDGEALVEAAKRYGSVPPENIRPMLLDVADSKQISEAVETVTKYVNDGHGHLKGLFNNAGIWCDYSNHPESLSVEFQDMNSYRKVFDVNFFGLVEMTKAFLPMLRKEKGRIIMNTSIAGRLAGPFFSSYAASKHAVEGFADSLRREMLPFGVKVSVLQPGFTTTPIFKTDIFITSKEPYTQYERNFWKSFWKDAIGAPSPQVTSQAVIHAMRSPSPWTRYLVGKDKEIVSAIIKFMPDQGLDSFNLYNMERKDEIVTEQELHELVEYSKTEFPL